MVIKQYLYDLENKFMSYYDHEKIFKKIMKYNEKHKIQTLKKIFNYLNNNLNNETYVESKIMYQSCLYEMETKALPKNIKICNVFFIFLVLTDFIYNKNFLEHKDLIWNDTTYKLYNTLIDNTIINNLIVPLYFDDYVKIKQLTIKNSVIYLFFKSVDLKLNNLNIEKSTVIFNHSRTEGLDYIKCDINFNKCLINLYYIYKNRQYNHNKNKIIFKNSIIFVNDHSFNELIFNHCIFDNTMFFYVGHTYSKAKFNDVITFKNCQFINMPFFKTLDVNNLEKMDQEHINNLFLKLCNKN